MDYRKVEINEIDRELFRNFRRRQAVTDCWRKEKGEWVIRNCPFIDEWSEEDYLVLVKCLRETVEAGGIMFGAFLDRELKGFAAVECTPMGSRGQYLDLPSLHVSEDMRGRGAGKELFRLAAAWAKEHGARSLYISGHSAVETQAFYKAMGCVEAEKYSREHVEMEPFDCQLEFILE